MAKPLSRTTLKDTLHLAIETTGRHGSVAVLLGQSVLRYTNLDPDRRTAAALAPVLDQSLRWCREREHWPRFVSVADGPGSFTGLRIGITTAKTLCYGLDLPLVPVDSLAAIGAAALVANPKVHSVCVANDAFRGQVFAGTFTREELLPPLESVPADWSAHPGSVDVSSGSQWEQQLSMLCEGTEIAGDEKPFRSLAASRLERTCDAMGVGLLAIRAAGVGRFINPLTLVPRYLRQSAAEEKAGTK